MPVMTEADGATKAQRGYIIGLTRQLQELLPIDSNVVARVERRAKVGEMSEEDAARLIAQLQTHIRHEKPVDRPLRAV
jgi:hypothetical protein